MCRDICPPPRPKKNESSNAPTSTDCESGHVGQIHDPSHPSQFPPGWNPVNPYFSIHMGVDQVGGGDARSGSSTWKTLPSPGFPLDSSQIRPPCRSTMPLLIAKPSPSPPNADPCARPKR